MTSRHISTTVVVALFLLTVAGRLFAQYEKYNDPDTPTIRASFTVVPNTDDVKELRAFIMYTNENWSPQMMKRYKDNEDYEHFLLEMAQAQLDAASRILTIIQEQGREENTNVDNEADRKNFIYSATSENNDTMFAIKTQIRAHSMLSTGLAGNKSPDSLDRFERFVESLERDPKRKDLGVRARSSWFNTNFYFARSLPDHRQQLMHFNKAFDQLKQYHAANRTDPLIKFFFDSQFFVQRQCAEGIESWGTSVKKGTLIVPMFEYYDSLYKTLDEDFVEQSTHFWANWPDYYEREMTTFRILAADDPMATFREAVDKKKAELENNLDEDSRMSLWPLSGTAEFMEQRVEALRYLYTTMQPVFAASQEDFAKEAIVVFDIELDGLALVGEELELEAVLLDGTKIDLKDFRGKVVLVDYWATWCGPCIGEFPTMKLVYDTYHKLGFEIIALSVDEDLDVWKAMIEKEELPWLNASEKLSLAQNLPNSREKYKIIAYPTPILIDRDGKVIHTDARGNILFEELEKLLPKTE